MRHSLLVRWLALTLGIALGSIIATAALATYGTTEQLKRQNPEASLVETDGAILRELNRYAMSHGSWKGVRKTVRELSDRYDRRIALTTPDGDTLADSHRVKLPPNAVATIDAAADTAERAARGQASDTTLPLVSASVADSSFAEEAYTVWTEESAEQAELCVQGFDEQVQGVVLTADGRPVAVRASEAIAVDASVREFAKAKGDGDVEKSEEPPSGGSSVAAQVELLDLSGSPCLPAEMKASTARTKKIDERQNVELRRCLDRAGVEYTENKGRIGTAAVELPDDAPVEQVRLCLREGTERALREFVAPSALLYLGTSDRFDAFSAEGFWHTAMMAFAVLLAAALVTVLAGRRMVRPIQALTGAAQQMASGDHSARVPESGRDEVARMGAAFNQMAESVQQGERQRKAMVSDVAHELRNPLANVRGYLEAVEDGVVELDTELVASLSEEARLLDRLVDDLQDLALADAGELRLHPEPCDLTDLAEQVATVHQAQADRAEVALLVRTVPAHDPTDDSEGAPEVRGADAVEPTTEETVVESTGAAEADEGTRTARRHDVLVDPARMRQAIGNLVSNALAYTSAGGQVVIEVRGHSVAVTDTGTGIAAEHLPHLFDRFYRADSSRSRRTGGSGLGLAITKHLVAAHGGEITVRSAVGEGTTFTLRLPPAEPADRRPGKDDSTKHHES